MRKDVRLGLAVGCILIGVLLVYVIFVASGKPSDNQANNNGTPPGDGGSAVVTGDPSPPVVGEDALHTTTPSGHDTANTFTGNNSSIIVGGPVTDTNSANNVTPWNATTVVDNPPPSTPASTGGWNWGDALTRGANPDSIAHSVTPTTPATRPVDPFVVAPPPPSGHHVAPPGGPAAGETYIVKPGESLWTIAKSVYGNPAYHPHIARANPGVNPNRLKAGTKLVLPPKEQVVPVAGDAPVAGGPMARPFDPATQYRVQAGDNLNVISKRLYGKADRVQKLYQLNRDAIGPNPNALKQNMVLQLPEAPTATGTTPAPASPLAGGL